MADDTFQVRVKRISLEAESINSYEFMPVAGGHLPAFTAGSHIDMQLPEGMIRSYSLINDQNERHRYVIAVNKDAGSRGGSRFVHETVRVGDILAISQPRNNFALNEAAEHTVLIGGGIGITPLLSMARRLKELGRPWNLHYAARTRMAAAFIDELDVLKGQGTVHLDFDDARDGRVFDLASIVAKAPANAHLYCCGPVPMLDAFEAATAGRPADHVHVEYFQAKDAPALDGGFEVELARSKRTVPVEKGKSILDALLDAGVMVNYACTEGVCGTCETGVIKGTPDHRDQFLSKDEQAANKTMMVCCSGSKSRTLVLDL